MWGLFFVENEGNVSVEEKEFYDKYLSLDENQKAVIDKRINYMLLSDDESEFVANNKKIIYNQYNKSIAPLIAKIEVYQHDLPKKCRALIETAFRCLTIASKDESKEQSLVESEYIALHKYMQYLTSTLYLWLIDLYIKEIKVIKRTIKKFNYKGIRIDNNRCIVDVVDANLKRIKELRCTGYKKYKPLTHRYKKYNLSDCCVSVSENNIVKELEDAFYLAEETLTKIQENFPQVISNGHNDTPIKCIVKYMPKIISGIIAIISIILILNK